MTGIPIALVPEQWQRLAAARQTYTNTVSPYYDETLQHVIQRACVTGDIGKAGIGALLIWKRLRADTPWAAELMALADTEVRRVTAAATTAARDTTLSRSSAAQAGRAALASLLPAPDRSMHPRTAPACAGKDEAAGGEHRLRPRRGGRDPPRGSLRRTGGPPLL